MNSSSRNGATVRCLAVHTTEGIMRAAQLRDWTGWAGSSHAAADETGALLDGAPDGFVDYDRAAWTIRNANPWTDNLELCARAGWTRTEWLARPRLLEACAVWLARRHRARGIPLTKLTVPQLRAGHRGVIDHDDYTDAYADGTHWDVGENFPWDVVLPRAIALAGPTPTPTPTPTKRKRRRTMWLTRDTTTGAIYLTDPAGMRHLQTAEEVNVCGWLLDDSRDASATLQHNARFHDVLLNVLSRARVQRRVGVGAAKLGPPAPVAEPDAIAAPPGFDVFDPDAPGHD